MNKICRQVTLQDNLTSEADPTSVCSFDYEAIERPTKALMHQAARFLYFKRGRGPIVIDGETYEIRPNMLVSITPWKISDVTEVEETLQLIKVVYDYQYINTVLKTTVGFEEDSVELLRFITAEPVIYLDSVQAEAIDGIMDQLKEELGVESVRMTPPNKPLTFLFTTNKILELMIMYRRYIMSLRGESHEVNRITQEPIMSYIYAHSSEKLTLEQTAKALFMSESSVAKQLQELTGTSFSKLLSSIRIEKASDYLIYTSLTLNEIADLLGFVDASHLTKHFVARVGVTPIRYRKIYSKVKTNCNKTDKDVAFRITDYLYQNFDQEHLTADEVASKVGVSIPQMNRALLFYSERNFDCLLTFIRINEACKLLTETDIPIFDIAIRVGYNNIKTFNLNFYKLKQMTPSAFRNSITLQKTDGSEASERLKPKKKGNQDETIHSG